LTPSFYNVDQIIGNDRVHSFPGLGIDNSPGPNKGNVYVAYATNASGTGDGGEISFSRSTDAGASFSSAVKLNERPGNDRSQWFPVVAVDSNTGRVNVMWDTQGVASSGDLMDMMWVYSDNGGVTWSSPSPVTTRPFHAGYGNDTGQPNLGDYNMAVAQGGALYAAFTTTPNQASFVDGEPSSLSFPYPSFLPGPNPSGFAKVTKGHVSLSLGPVSFTDSGGNGFADAGDTLQYTLPLFNFVTNPTVGLTPYSAISASLSSGTPGVTVASATSGYPVIGSGTTQLNNSNFVVQIAPNFTPGTKIEFSLYVTTAQGSTTLRFTQNTGTPVPSTVFSENFNGVAPGSLPAGWALSHAGGANTVPWTTNNTFCGTGSNGVNRTVRNPRL
jgi:hypothetical protein